jgi:hypothetical protein
MCREDSRFHQREKSITQVRLHSEERKGEGALGIMEEVAGQHKNTKKQKTQRKAVDSSKSD